MNIHIIMIHYKTMIDLHTHLLFDMDDGAKDLNDSLALFNIQKNQGVHKVVLTPHFEAFRDDLDQFISNRSKNAEALQNALDKDVEFKLGAEVLFTVDLLNMDLNKLVIEGTDYILFEFSTRGYVSDVKRHMMTFIQQGYLPIFAHIERYSFLKDDLSLMKELVEMGVLFQVNASTFVNNEQHSFIKACMKNNLIHLVASDAHSQVKRPCNLSDAYAVIEQEYGIDTVNYLKDNAECVYHNELVEVKEPKVIRKFLKKYY